MLRPTRQLNTQPSSEGEDGGKRRRVKRLRRKKKKEAAVVKRKVPGSVLLIACVLVIITAFSRLHNRRGPKDSSLRRSSFSVPDSKLRNMNNGIAKEDSLPLDSIYRTSFPVMNRPGDDFSLSQLMGKVAIVINVASHCGKTDLTYEHIGTMLQRYSSSSVAETRGQVGGEDNNLYILAFPTNDFHQEEGSDEDIEIKVKELLGEDLYQSKHFLLFRKGSLADNPVYQLLRKHMPEHRVQHNFFKYLIGRNGVPVGFYPKKTTLLNMEEDIQEHMGLSWKESKEVFDDDADVN